MNDIKPQRGIHRIYLMIVGSAALVAALCAAFAATLVGTSSAAPNVAPSNTGEPAVSGTTRVGQVLRTTRGSWTGTQPIDYFYRWFRCDGRGAPDASDCRRITNASDNTYVLRQADAGFRIRSQVMARNLDGQATATSNPTNVVISARPTNTTEPSISGTAAVGNRLQANRGQWGGEQPITYTFVWLRCNDKGENCSEIQGANDPEYEVRDSDVGRTIRVRVIARNDRGATSAISNPTNVVGSNQPAPGTSVTVESLKAAGDRLVRSPVTIIETDRASHTCTDVESPESTIVPQAFAGSHAIPDIDAARAPEPCLRSIQVTARWRTTSVKCAVWPTLTDKPAGWKKTAEGSSS